MPIHDIQSSFAGGEVSPDLHGRVDLAKYKSSAKKLRNFIPGPHGSAYNRPGTYFVAKTKTGSQTSRLVPFVPSSSAAYVLEFGDSYIRFYTSGSQILSGGLPYEVSTPYAAADIPNLRFARSADTLYIAHPSYAPRTLQRVSDTSWTLALYAFVNGPFMFPNTNTALTMEKSSSQLKASAAYFHSGMEGAIFRLEQFIANADLTAAITGSSTGVIEQTQDPPPGGVTSGDLISTLPCGNTWRILTSGTWTGKIVVQQSLDGGTTWDTVRTFSSTADANFDTFGTVDLTVNNGQPYLMRAYVLAHASGTVNVRFSTDSFTYYKYITTSTFVNSTHLGIASETSDFIDIQKTSLWSEGSWSTYRGWPSAVNFFQDRLAFAATPTEPQAVWLTKTSNYVDFGRDIPLIDSDGITINLQSRTVSPAVNLVSSLNTLVAFTSSSYWSITGESGALTPTTIVAKLQEQRGINAVEPATIGNRLIFVDARGANVRDIEYQYLSDRYQSENISTYADHFFKGYTIVDMAYQQNPDSILWLIRSDGVALSCTYLREQEVLAWAQHDTNGTFESVCTIPGSGVDEVWFIVHRGSYRMVERMLLRTVSTSPADQYFVDCGLAYSGVSTSSLSGYDHLNGLTVAIQANGVVKAQQTVSGGVVTVPAGTTKAAVGLPYTCDAETLNPEYPMQDGTAQGRKYQISRVIFRFLNTMGGYAGVDISGSLDAINFSASPTYSSGSLFTGFVDVSIPQGTDPRSHVAFRQVDPMPVTILSILPLVNTGQNP